VRLALKVVVQNDGDFMDVILLCSRISVFAEEKHNDWVSCP